MLTLEKLLFAIVVGLAFAIKALGEVPPPMILGVCEIEKMDGSVTTGYIVVARHTVDGDYETSGFVLADERGREYARPFTPNFQPLNVEEWFNSSELGPVSPKRKILFYQEVSAVSIPAKQQNSYSQTQQYVNGVKVVDLEQHVRRRLAFMDFVPIYTALPEKMYLPFEPGSRASVRIPISEIRSFRLQHPVSPERQREISAAENRFFAAHSEKAAELLTPAWWHEFRQGDHFNRWPVREWDFGHVIDLQ